MKISGTSTTLSPTQTITKLIFIDAPARQKRGVMSITYYSKLVLKTFETLNFKFYAISCVDLY